MAGIKARIPKIHPPPAQIKRLRRCFLLPLEDFLSRVTLFYRPLTADLSRVKGTTQAARKPLGRTLKFYCGRFLIY
jgi:hypothetical protein